MPLKQEFTVKGLTKRERRLMNLPPEEGKSKAQLRKERSEVAERLRRRKDRPEWER